MATTKIKQANNNTKHYLMFVKLEDTGNNRYIDSSKTSDVGSCTVPHCDNDNDFLTKAIIITSLDSAEVIAYIWQHKSDTDDDAVRYSTDGWHDSGHKLEGYSDVGSNMDITINADGTIEGIEVNQ